MQVRARIVLVDPDIDLQAAIDSLPAGGGVISLGPGTFNVTGLTIDKPLLLQGSGMDTTTIQMDASLVNVDVISVQSRYVVMEDLTVAGPNAAGSGRGIAYAFGDALWNCGLTRVCVEQTAAECLFFPNSDGGTVQDSVILSNFTGCRFKENNSGVGAVYIGWQHTTLIFKNCSFTRFRGSGLYAQYAYGCKFDGCDFSEPLTDTGPSVAIIDCSSMVLSNCWFENTTDQQLAGQYHVVFAGSSYGNKLLDCSMHFGPNTSVYHGAVNGPDNPRCVYVGGGSTPGFCCGNVIENLWAYIERGSHVASNNIVIAANAMDTQIIGGGISDLDGSVVSGVSLSSGVLTRSGSWAVENISVGDPVYPVAGHIPDGAYVTVVGTTTMTIAVHGGSAMTDGTGLTILTNPGGKIEEFSISSTELTRPATVQTGRRWRLPRLTTAQRNALDTATVGDMAWITDAAAGHEWQVYNGAGWKYLTQN